MGKFWQHPLTIHVPESFILSLCVPYQSGASSPSSSPSLHYDPRPVVDICYGFFIYRLLFVFLFFCFFVRRIFVTDISGVGGRTAVKLWRMVDLGVRQVMSPFGELWPRG